MIYRNTFCYTYLYAADCREWNIIQNYGMLKEEKILFIIDDFGVREAP